MRSLEKVAKEKGLVKDKDFTKTASAKEKTDLSISPKLAVNLIKLSVGLREAGFDKYADELEDNFVVYKQAQTLYETSKEKGEDLVDAAHPKGSHKLENVDGSEAVFETILDQHLGMLKTIENIPKGKLSSVEVINEARKIFGQAPKIEFPKMDLPPASEVTPDGMRANASYVSSMGNCITLGYYIAGLTKLREILNSDSRIPEQKARLAKLDDVFGKLKDMTQRILNGWKGAYDKAKQIETTRKGSDAYRADPKYALVEWNEVSSFFTGIGGPMGGVDSFTKAYETLADGSISVGNQLIPGATTMFSNLGETLKGVESQAKDEIEKMKIGISNAAYQKGKVMGAPKLSELYTK